MLDIGTGTGRMLELFAGRYERALGVDLSPAMLAVARANLERAAIEHARVRLGDVMNLPVVRDSFDLVVIHQVLHFLDEPARALAKPLRRSRAGGRLVIVDFAPHELEHLRESQAHRRLGFSHAQMKQWIAAAGLRARGGGGSRAGGGSRRTDRHHLDGARPARGGMPAAARPRRGCERRASIARRSAAPRTVSFEFFPPKTEAQAAMLDDTVARLSRLRPRYVSVTYGAGGTSQERSLGTVQAHARARACDRRASHLRRREPRLARARRSACSAQLGIERFVALRGDPPGGLSEPYRAASAGLSRHGASWSTTLKRAGAAEVSVSAYPERHPQSADWETEIAVLKRKVDAGADRAITQFFFDNDLYERYRRARAPRRHRHPDRAGHHADPPLPVGARLRRPLRRDDSGKPRATASRGSSRTQETHAGRGGSRGEQMADLVARGVDAFHIYTLNRAELTEAVCRVWARRRQHPPAQPEATREREHGCRRLLRRGSEERRVRRAQRTPKTIAPRKMKAAQTATIFRGLMKVIGWPPSASRDASLTRKRRVQNRKSVMHCETCKPAAKVRFELYRILSIA